MVYKSFRAPFWCFLPKQQARNKKQVYEIFILTKLIQESIVFSLFEKWLQVKIIFWQAANR